MTLRRNAWKRLQTRLLFWFLGAILLAIASSGIVVALTRPEIDEAPTRVVARTIQMRLARTWEDPKASEAYVRQLRDTTGLDLHIRRDVEQLPIHTRRMGGRSASVTFDEGMGYIPILHEGVLVGALEFHAGAASPRLWRVFLALGAALVVLGVAAGRVSKRLSRPLEEVARAAERFGAGNLSARTEIGDTPRRWVAEEVREVAIAFDAMAERIEKVVRDQRELLAAISHELRSPLGRARVALEIARDRASGDAEQARPLDVLEREIGEVDTILADLLAAARAGLSDLRLETVAIGPWLRARLAAEPGLIELVSVDDAKVAIDSALLGRALHNVIANARIHGHPESVPLEVRVEPGGPSRTRLTVRDRGPGFPPELLPRAFDAFVRGDAARTPRGGTGLGLALVRRIAEAHGGTASARNVVENDVVSGAEVTIELANAPLPESRPS